jgi:triosephosphate isomerase
MRKPVIAGNWKMNKTIAETEQFINELLNNIKAINESEVEVIISPVFTSLETAVKLCKDTNIKVAAQNMHWEEQGAFTGEVSPLMLSELGVTHCIIGHSERRQYFAETDQTVNKKVKAALKHNIIPIICVGETLEEREANTTVEVVQRQVKGALVDLNASQVTEMILAYEPVWAIGTGKTASDEDAQDVISRIRKIIADDFGNEISEKVRILYGGSVKPNNIKGLMQQKDIDGALVGGASLKADSFLSIIQNLN